MASARALSASASFQSSRSIATSARAARASAAPGIPPMCNAASIACARIGSASSKSPSSTDAQPSAINIAGRSRLAGLSSASPISASRRRSSALSAPIRMRRNASSPRIVLPSGSTSSAAAAAREFGPPLGIVRTAEIGVDRGAVRRNCGMGLDQVVLVEPLDPAQDGVDASARERGLGERRDQARDPIRVTTGLRVLDRHLGQPVRFEPRGRPAMELGHQGRLAAAELGAQQIAEEVVIPVPLPAPVEGHEEQVRTLELLEHVRRTLHTEHGVAQRPAHPVEHGGARQERDFGGAEVREQLGSQVVGHEAIVTRERRADTTVGTARLQRERREIEAGRPPFRPLEHLLRDGVRELGARTLEQRARFPDVHRELVDTDLDDVATGPESRDRDRRIAACRQRELRTGREVQRELGDRVEALGVLQEIDVIERERDRFAGRGHGARQPGDRRRGDDFATLRAVTAAPVRRARPGRSLPPRRSSVFPGRCRARRSTTTRPAHPCARPTGSAASSCRIRAVRRSTRPVRARRRGADRPIRSAARWPAERAVGGASIRRSRAKARAWCARRFGGCPTDPPA